MCFICSSAHALFVSLSVFIQRSCVCLPGLCMFLISYTWLSGFCSILCNIFVILLVAFLLLAFWIFDLWTSADVIKVHFLLPTYLPHCACIWVLTFY